MTLPQVTKEILAAVPPYVRAEPKKSLIERGKEKAKEMYDRTGETAKDAADKMKDMMKPTTPAPATAPSATPPCGDACSGSERHAAGDVAAAGSGGQVSLSLLSEPTNE